MGTTKSCVCDDIVKNTAITCAGKVKADYEWRKSYKDPDWMLNPSIFHKTINHRISEPDLVSFASRLNIKLPKYISYNPVPHAYFIDAFSVYWGFYNCYLLPVFSLIRRTLQNICMDQREVVLAVRKQPTQPWYNSFQGQFFQEPYVVISHKENLLLPQKQNTWLNGWNLVTRFHHLISQLSLH